MTSPILSQAVQVTAHTGDTVFSACLNKQGERQKQHGKSLTELRDVKHPGRAFKQPEVRTELSPPRRG